MLYAVGIRPGTTVWVPGTAPLPAKAWSGRGTGPRSCGGSRATGQWPCRPLAMTLPAQAWRTVTWREGTHTGLSSCFAGARVRPAHRDYLRPEMRAEEWLLIEWPKGEDAPTKYFLTTAPDEATLEQMVFVTKMRWRIERDYQDLKQDFGLGHYEGRGWRGFHHHATLSIAAYGFLMAQRLKAGGNASSKRNFTQRQVPAVPKDYIPRGSPTRAASRTGLDGDAAPVLGRRTRKHPGTLPAVSLGKSEITFIT